MKTILAPNGQPAADYLRDRVGATATPPRERALGYGLYATPATTGQSDYYRPRFQIGASIDLHLNTFQWQEILSYSRQLFAQLGNLGGAICQKAMFAVGEAWKPQFFGGNKGWGQEVERWLTEEWMPVCDVRGPAFGFSTNLFLDSIALDVDGDAAMILAVTERGFPQLKFIPAHRIAGYEDSIKEGAFRGAKLCNGVILNREGRAIGYRITGERQGDYQDVSAFNCQLLFEPEWQSQSRGIPRVGRVLLDWFDVQDIDGFLKRGVKLDASQGVLHYTDTGEADSAANVIADAEDTDASGLRVEQLNGGEIMYFKAGTSERIEPFRSDRPHPNTEAFIARLERRGLLAVGWHYELIDPSRIGGASVRLIQDQARASIRFRQRAIRLRAKRAVTYAVALAMKNRLIPRNEADWWKWDFELPAQLTVDAGYDRQADVEDLKLGLTTKAAITAKCGRWWEDVDAQKDREFEALLTRAKAHADKFNLPLEYVIDRLEQRTPNPAPLVTSEPQKKEQEP